MAAALTNTTFNINDTFKTSTVVASPNGASVTPKNIPANVSQEFTFVISTTKASNEAVIDVTNKQVELPSTDASATTGITVATGKEYQFDTGGSYLAYTDIDFSISNVQGSYDTDPVASNGYPSGIVDLEFSEELRRIYYSGDLPKHLIVTLRANFKVDLTAGSTYDYILQEKIAYTYTWDLVEGSSESPV